MKPFNIRPTLCWIISVFLWTLIVSQVSNVATIDVGNNLSDHLPVVLRLHLPSDQSGIYRNENNNIN